MMLTRGPRGNRDPEIVRDKLRRARTEPHVAGINAWIESHSLTMPLLDPDDGGAEARIMFLMESPGPKADATWGTGLLSDDNDSPTASNMWQFRKSTGLADHIALRWNAVPWFLGTAERRVVAPKSSEIVTALPILHELMSRLPNLEVVMPLGGKAQKSWSRYVSAYPNDLTVIPTWHPSPMSMNQAGKRDELLAAFKRAAIALGVVAG